MKRSFLFLVAVVIFCACKKDGSSGKKMFLSKVFINDLLAEEYIYSSDMKPVRMNVYNTSLGQSTFAGFRLYEYTGDLLTTVLFYTKNNTLNDRRVLTYNASKQLSRQDNYGADDDIEYYNLFEYDNKQRISKITSHSVSLSKKVAENFIAWNDQDNLTSIRRYYLSGTNWLLNDSITFTSSNKSLPDHWNFYELLPYDYLSDRIFWQMPAETVYYYMSGGPPIKNNQTYSQKVYNNAGYLISQHYKLEVDNAINITTYNYDLNYEYIE